MGIIFCNRVFLGCSKEKHNVTPISSEPRFLNGNHNVSSIWCKPSFTHDQLVVSYHQTKQEDGSVSWDMLPPSKNVPVDEKLRCFVDKVLKIYGLSEFSNRNISVLSKSLYVSATSKNRRASVLIPLVPQCQPQVKVGDFSFLNRVDKWARNQKVMNEIFISGTALLFLSALKSIVNRKFS